MIQRGHDGFFTLFLRHDRVVWTYAAQHILKQKIGLGSEFLGFLEADHFDALEADMLGDKGEEIWRDGALVGGVEVKTACCHHDVLGIGSFENQKASRQEDSLGLAHQLFQGIEGNMLDNMEGGNDGLRLGGQGAQVGDGLAFFRRQT